MFPVSPIAVAALFAVTVAAFAAAVAALAVVKEVISGVNAVVIAATKLEEVGSAAITVPAAALPIAVVTAASSA
jgi:hypothetical protein